MIPFAAVLLAGGQSRRMGRDKALLPLADGRSLWQRQLGVLQELEPAELFISGPAREGFPADVPLLADATPGLGPLSGIAAALGAMRSPLLVVLAVDMPMMTTDFLLNLLADGQGVIPQTDDGFFEPLAAVYPRSAFMTANVQRRSMDHSLQTFVRRLITSGQATARPLTSLEMPLFVNWNYCSDDIAF